MTSWWTAPGVPSELGWRLFLDLIEGVAGRFTGQQLSLVVRGQPVALTLTEVAIDPGSADGEPRPRPHSSSAHGLPWLPDMPFEAAWGWLDPTRNPVWTFNPLQPLPEWSRPPGTASVLVKAKELTVAGTELEELTALATDARIEPGLVPILATGPIDLEAAMLTQTAAHLAEQRAQRGWLFEAQSDGSVSIRRARWRAALIVRPTFSGSKVGLAVVAVGIFGRRVHLPAWLSGRWRRSFEIPLPSPLELVEIAQAGDRLMARLRHPGVEEPISLERVRQALRTGINRLVLDPG